MTPTGPESGKKRKREAAAKKEPKAEDDSAEIKEEPLMNVKQEVSDTPLVVSDYHGPYVLINNNNKDWEA